MDGVEGVGWSVRGWHWCILGVAGAHRRGTKWRAGGNQWRRENMGAVSVAGMSRSSSVFQVEERLGALRREHDPHAARARRRSRLCWQRLQRVCVAATAISISIRRDCSPSTTCAELDGRRCLITGTRLHLPQAAPEPRVA